MSLRRRALVAAVVLAGASAGPARAADVPPDVQRSMSAYERARKLIDSGDCATAIPLLEESIRYNDSIGAHLSIAECRPNEPLGAYREYKLAAALAQRKGDGRARYAQEQVTALEGRVALLRIVLPAPRTVALLDGKTVDDAEIADPIAVEAGAHTIELVRPDGTRRTKSVSAVVGQTVRVADEPDAAARVEPQPSPPEGSSGRTLPFVVGGAGLAVGIAGAVFGVLASSKLSDAKDVCPHYPRCADPGFDAGQSANDSAKTFAVISSIGIGVGVVTLAAGVVLYIARPRRPATTATTALRLEF